MYHVSFSLVCLGVYKGMEREYIYISPDMQTKRYIYLLLVRLDCKRYQEVVNANATLLNVKEYVNVQSIVIMSNFMI